MQNGDSKKKRWPCIALAVIAGVALLACLLLGGMLYLPDVASRYIPVEQIRRLGFRDFSGRITRIGVHQAAAGPFVFGRIDQPAISIGSVTADYSPAGLLRQTIDGLRIDDLTVHASLGPEGIILPGWDRGRPDERAPAGPSGPGPLLAKLDGAIGKIEIRSARLILNWRQATYRIPFEADIQTAGAGPTALTAQLRLLPGDQRILLNARLDLADNGGDLALEGPALHLDRFGHLFHHVPGLDLTGILSLAARARLRIEPLAISNAEFKVAWRGGRAVFGAFSTVPESEDGAVRLTVASQDLVRWQADFEGLRLQTPAPVTVTAVTAAADLAAAVPSFTGSAALVFRPFALQCPRPVSLKNDLGLSLAWDIRKQTDKGWSAACYTNPLEKTHHGDRLHLTVDELQLQSGGPQFRMEASRDEQGVQARWQATLPNVAAVAAGLTAKLPQVLGEGRMRIKVSDGETHWGGDARAEIPEIALAGRGLSGLLKELVLSASVQPKSGRAPRVQGRLRVPDGRVVHAASGMQLAALRLDWPYDSDSGSSQGSFSTRLEYRRNNLGQLRGRVNQEAGGVRLTASHTSAFFPGMTAAINGHWLPAGEPFPEVALHLEIPAFDLPASHDLGRLRPALGGMTLSGTVSARAAASITAAGIRATGDLALKGGRLEIAKKKFTVEGIDTALHFPELPRLRSGPAQSVRFARAALGGIVVDGGRFDFQVESPTTLFVEKGRLAWCGGTVDAQSLRVTAGKREYALGLYCQRLELSRILEQLGAVNARGSGTVNGRIPIVYSNKRVRFDDGFLFSTPGEPGQIQLTGTEILTRGIPMGTPQFAQVDLAREALKDYTYEWAKLGMTTEGESLVMRLQFDGQPAGPLPFVYRKEIGSFVRVEAGAQGSLFQGISLDVNLKLPLDRLLEYKEIVDRIQ